MSLRNLRIHARGEPRPRAGGEFVLYWMQMTQRAHDNFALDFAIDRANELGVPVLAVFRLRHDYPWASDRFHAFMLEAMAGMEEPLAARGVQWALCVADRDGREIESLARRAALVVTDFYPTFIAPRQVVELRRATDTPVVALDSCTIVPMGYHDHAHRSARGIRPRLLEALPHFLEPVEAPVARVARRVDPGFEPQRIGMDEIDAFLAAAPIDHTVCRVRGFTGGTAAARARLTLWTARGLVDYDEERNDPDIDATSRMSPWLHFGHVSPHEVLRAARDAAPGAQYEKFRDELVTWRELAYNFTYFDPKHRTVAAIPAWAREELQRHEADPREALYSLEEMEGASTGNPLWNRAQRDYVEEGWMHNRLRMIWGKAVIGWTRDAATALGILEFLNNRYALDGRDPCTYGGIHWCFGKFDRPFYRRPVYGTVRYMKNK